MIFFLTLAKPEILKGSIKEKLSKFTKLVMVGLRGSTKTVCHEASWKLCCGLEWNSIAKSQVNLCPLGSLSARGSLHFHSKQF